MIGQLLPVIAVAIALRWVAIADSVGRGIGRHQEVLVALLEHVAALIVRLR